MENNSKLTVKVIFISLVSVTILNAQERGSSDLTMEHNTNRAGADYERFEMNDPEPELCAEACKNDPNCKAFTFVKAGIQEEKAVCYLKNEITTPIDNVDCISGVKVDIPVQEMQIIKPMDPDNQHLQVSGDPNAMMGMPPSDMDVPRVNIFIKRKETIKSAESIPELKQQLTEITRSIDVNLEQLYTQTIGGDEALHKIDKGKSYGDSKNLGPKGAPTDASQIDWSGGIQLTPMRCVSSKGIWIGNKYESVAKMDVLGIIATHDTNIGDMASSDYVYVSGRIHLDLRLPNSKPEPYLITMQVMNWTAENDKTLNVEVSDKNWILNYGKLQLNGAGDKYHTIINMGGPEIIIYVFTGKKSQIVYSVTITKL